MTRLSRERHPSPPAAGAPTTAPIDRTVLSIPEPKPPTIDVLDARNVVPAGTKLAPKPEHIKDGDRISADEKRLLSHQMEVFSGSGEYADHEIGRLIEAIAETGQLDNTLVLYVLGDNARAADRPAVNASDIGRLQKQAAFD